MAVKVDVGRIEPQKFTFSILLWGEPGAGKTRLATTAPGNKLFLMFDNNGDNTIGQSKYEKDCLVYKAYKNLSLDLVKSGYNSFENPFGIAEVCKANEIKTVIFDSTTSYDDLCLKYAITQVDKATIDKPSLQGYGIRNTAMQEAIRNLMAFCSRNELNLIVIAHSAPPEKDETTGAMSQTLMLGGKLPAILPSKFDEVWYLDKRGADYFIMLSATRKIKPMKTRMFSALVPEFQWKLNEETDKHTIKEWYNLWVEGKGAKVPVPS